MAFIAKHLNKIKSTDLYLEQTAYQNISEIVSQAH
jgi:hypothetical protein